MGLGTLILYNIGKENVYLSAEPEITFFKMTYKRYTNYSIEQTPQYFKTTPDFGRRCTVNIGKNADLMSSIFIYINLPSIINDYNYTISNNNFLYQKMAWVNKVGMAIINFVEIEIGGTIIDRHYGDWLNIWNELTIKHSHLKSYNMMIGNIDKLTNFTINKNNHILYIPLSFWFCNDSGLALPLISLLHNDIKLHVQFNDINYCYKISPSHSINVDNKFCILKYGEIIYQIYKNIMITGQFIYFDELNQILYYNPINNKFIIPELDNDDNLSIYGIDTNFKINITPKTIIVKIENYFQYIIPSIVD